MTTRAWQTLRLPLWPCAATPARGASAGVKIGDGVLLLLLAAAFRLAWLGHPSLWIDELFSVFWSKLDLHFLLTEGLGRETNPPGYYLLLHGWMRLFGDGEFVVRLPSALASAATTLLTYALGLRQLGRRGALFAGFLYAINPVAIAFGQEARAYAPEALVEVAALWALPVSAPLFVLLSVAALALHYTAIFFVAACFLACGISLLRQRPAPRGALARWLASGLAFGVLASPLLMAALAQSGSANLVWIGPQTGSTILWFVLLLLAPLSSFGWSCLGAGALLLTCAWGWGKTRLKPVAPALWVACLYCLLFITAGWFRPMLLPRVATWLEAPLCLVLAQATFSQPAGARRLLAGLVPAAVFLAGTAFYFSADSREDWRQVARIVTTDPDCRGPVLVTEFNALGLVYYGIHPGKPAAVFLADPRRRNSVEFYLSERLMHLPELAAPEAVDFVQAHPHTALIMRGEYATRIPQRLQDMVATAPLHRILAGGLTVACFP